MAHIFIDLDHALDYIFFHKKMCWRFSDLEKYCAEERTGKMYLVFHSYEFLIIAWAVVWFFRLNQIWTAFVFGLSIHLVCDHLINKTNFLAYFWFYRAKQGFQKKILHEREDLERNLNKQESHAKT
ncbi:MAG: hypothetical protein ABIJ41_05240 [Candidatus Omnitrophota bacterium]